MEALIDKQYKQYDYLSRYTRFPYYFNRLDNKYIYGTTAQLNKDASYTLHKVKRNETLDTLALDYFNNPTFFWVIADFNDIQDPFIKLKEGQELKIPSLNEVSYGD